MQLCQAHFELEYYLLHHLINWLRLKMMHQMGRLVRLAPVVLGYLHLLDRMVPMVRLVRQHLVVLVVRELHCRHQLDLYHL